MADQRKEVAMGSSDSQAVAPMVDLLFGESTDLSRLSATECVQLLRGFFAHVQPCHKYLPAKSVDELAKLVRPLSSRVKVVAPDHPFYQPIMTKGVSRRDKCVELGVDFGFVHTKLRSEHSESHRPLLWTRSGELVAITYYFSNEVGGTVAMDFTQITDEHLYNVFDKSSTEYVRITRKMLTEIITSTLFIITTMVEEREQLVAQQRSILDVGKTVSSLLVVPTRPFSY